MTEALTKKDSLSLTAYDLAKLDEKIYQAAQKIRQAEQNLAKMKKDRAKLAADHNYFRLFIFRCKKKKAALQV